jgi:hypothetical protein
VSFGRIAAAFFFGMDRFQFSPWGRLEPCRPEEVLWPDLLHVQVGR